VAFVQAWANSTPASTQNVTVAPSAGRVLLAWQATDATSTAPTAIPSGFETTPLVDATSTTDGSRLTVWIKKNTTGAETTVTMSDNSGNLMIAGVAEFSGIDTTTPLDVAAVPFNTSTSVTTGSASITPVTNGCDLAIVHLPDGPSGDRTVSYSTSSGATSAWTVRVDQTDGGFFNVALGTASQTTAGALTAQATQSISGGLVMVLIALRPSTPTGPTINTQPTDQTAFNGGSVTFTSLATASAGSLTWAWQDNSGGSFANISTGSASPATLNVGPVTAAMNGRRYRIQWTDSNGTITSSEATLFVRSQIGDSRLSKVRAAGSRSGLFLLDPKNWGGPSLIVEKWFAPELAPSSGGSTNVNVNDSATGSDAASVNAALTCADSGVGADTAGIAATLAGQTDSGTGTDTATPAPAIAGADSGTGTDTAAFAPAIAGTDSGAGTDTPSIAGTLAGQTDSGTGTDAAAIAPAIAGTDSGTGSDSATPGPAISGTDTSAGAEQAAINAAAGISDSAAGTDTAAAAVAVSPTDSSTGTDTAALAVAVGLADTGTGADAPTLGVNIDLTDSATGTDQVSVAENATPINVSDSGVGSDAVSVAAIIDGADAGIGGDTGTVAASVALSDTAAGTDSVSVDTSGTQQVGVSDSGSGSDSVSVEKTEGLDLTLIGRNVRFKPLKKPRQPEAPAEPRKPTPSPLIKALVERAKPRSTGVGEVTIAPAPVAPVVIDLPEVRVVATPTPAPKAPPPPPPSPENPVPLPTAAVTPAPKPPERPKPIAVEMVSVPKAAWDALTADVERFALHIATLEAQLADTKGQLAKARRAANQAQAQLLALQLLEE